MNNTIIKRDVPVEDVKLIKSLTGALEFSFNKCKNIFGYKISYDDLVKYIENTTDYLQFLHENDDICSNENNNENNENNENNDENNVDQYLSNFHLYYIMGYNENTTICNYKMYFDDNWYLYIYNPGIDFVANYKECEFYIINDTFNLGDILPDIVTKYSLVNPNIYNLIINSYDD